MNPNITTEEVEKVGDALYCTYDMTMGQAQLIARWHLEQRLQDAQRIKELEETISIRKKITLEDMYEIRCRGKQITTLQSQLKTAVEALEFLHGKSYNEPLNNLMVLDRCEKALSTIAQLEGGKG